MANTARTQRRKEERARRRATRQIPPEVKARIAQINQGTAPPPPPPTNGGGGADAPSPPPQEAPPSPLDDLPPGIPSDLPPAIAKAIEDAQSAAGGEIPKAPPRAPGGAGTTAVGKARSKRFVDLEKELAILLSLPAPLFEGGGDEYCAAHFAIQGPLLANRLTSYAETNPRTAELLERIVAAGGFAVVGLAIFSYALPPMLHHGLPAPEGLRKMYNVPEKEHRHPPEGEDGGE